MNDKKEVNELDLVDTIDVQVEYVMRYITQDEWSLLRSDAVGVVDDERDGKIGDPSVSARNELDKELCRALCDKGVLWKVREKRFKSEGRAESFRGITYTFTDVGLLVATKVNEPPLEPRRVWKYTTRMLRCKLTEEERRDRTDSLTHEISEVRRLNEEKAASSQQYSAQIK